MNSANWSELDALFVFGSLMDPQVLELVSGMPLTELVVTPATVQGYRQGVVAEENYPVLVACESSETSGLLIKGLSSTALERILFFEGEEYALQPIDVRVPGEESAQAFYFRDTGVYTVRENKWDFDQWTRLHKASFIDVSRQYMALFGNMTAAEADAHWTALQQQADPQTRATGAT